MGVRSNSLIHQPIYGNFGFCLLFSKNVVNTKVLSAMSLQEIPLVSMITYCYNGARFVHKYFDALLAQSYQNIELFFFDNGSADNTWEIAESYRERLLERGIIVNYIRNETNQLTCACKQYAISKMSGKYFFGVDSDDIIYPDYIEEMVSYLENHPDKGLVFCTLNVVREETGEKICTMQAKPQQRPLQAFEDILLGLNTTFTAISYMMSSDHFQRINPSREIFLSQYGENYQLLMPFLYHNIQGYLDKILGQYTVRSDSYSSQLKLDKKLAALKGQELSIFATLEQIQPERIDYHKSMAARRLRHECFHVALKIKDSMTIAECYQELAQYRPIQLRDKIEYIGSKISFVGKIIDLFKNNRRTKITN